MEAAQDGLTEGTDNRQRRRTRTEVDDRDAAHHGPCSGDSSSTAGANGRFTAAKRRPRAPLVAVPDGRPHPSVRAPSTPIQRVLEVCEAAFKGPGTVPSPAHVVALRSLLDSLRPEDVGVADNTSFWLWVTDVGGTAPGITCMSIASHDNFSVCVFFLPAASVMPLHDHPGMTVFSRLLTGSMQVKAYDWVDVAASLGRSVGRCASLSPSSSSIHEKKLAKVVVDAVLAAPCRTTVLYPASGGNMHTFTALTSCAVLDVLGPSYSALDGRDCSYYQARPCCGRVTSGSTATLSGSFQRYAWLEEVEPPQGLIPLVPYTGPLIFDR